MGLLDSVRSAVSRATDAVVQVKQDVVAKLEDPTAQARAEVSGKVSSFSAAASNPELLGAARAELKAELPTNTVRAGDPSSLAAKLVAAEKKAGYFETDDVALENAKNLSPDQLQQLAQSTDGRAALNTMIGALGEGWVAKDEQAQIDRLKNAIATTPLLTDQQTAALKNNPNPSTSMIGTIADNRGGVATPWPEATQTQIAKVDTLVAQNTLAASGTPAEVDAMVKKTIADSQSLDPLMAGDLLSRTCDSLLAQGKTDAVRELAKELKSPRLSGTGVDTVGHLTGLTGQTVAPNGNEIHYLQKGGIDGKLGAIGDTRIAQADQLDRMSKALGRPVDPQNINDVKAYFAVVKKSEGMAGATKEFASYVSNFTKHPGGPRTDWKDARSDLVDPDKLTKILSGQPRDGAGRTILDCEGHTWLAAAVFGKDNDVVFMNDASHIAVSVFDKKTGEGFFVNTMAAPIVQSMPERPKTEAKRNELTAQYFAGNGVKKGSGKVPANLGYVGNDVERTRPTSSPSSADGSRPRPE